MTRPVKKTRPGSGFTIVELLISISMASIMTLVITTVVVFFYGDVLRSQATAQLAVESQVVLRKIIEDVRIADAIHPTNQIADPNAPSGGWTVTDPAGVIIIATPALTAARDIIYNTSTGLPYENENIYFRSGGVFYRRILKNTSAIGSAAVTTCPAAQVTASCPQDIILTSNVNQLSFVFYDINNATTTDASKARSVAITINMLQKVYGVYIYFNNTVQTTLRNY